MQDTQLPAQLDDRALAGLLAAVRDNVVMPADVVVWIRRLAGDETEPDAEGERILEDAGRGFFRHALNAVDEAGDFHGFARVVGKAAGVRGRALFMPLRVALTGLAHGPEMQRVWAWLGPERCRMCLQNVLNRWNGGVRPDA